MQNKLFVSEKFYYFDESFEQFLDRLREIYAPLEEFSITLVFRGGGWDDDIWCDWEGIVIWGWRYKTADELAAEAEAQMAKEAREKAEADRLRRKHIRAQAKSLRDEQIDLAHQLEQAQAELADFQKENPDV